MLVQSEAEVPRSGDISRLFLADVDLGMHRRQASSRQKLRETASLLPFLGVCAALIILTGCAWPMYRQGATRTGRSGFDTSSNTGTVQTCYNFGEGQNQFPYGPLLSFPGASGGIFLGDLSGNIYSISNTCTLAWMYPTGAVAATPNGIGLDGNIYATQAGGTLFAINSSGVLKWTFAPPGGMSNAELAIDQDGTIYGGSQCGVFYALNPNGTVKWKYSAFSGDCPDSFKPIVSPALSSLTIGEDATIYSGVQGVTGPGVLFALTPGGKLLWYSTTYTGTPAVAPNGNIYVVGDDDQNIYALNSAGVLQWQVAASGTNTFSLPAIAPDSSLYVGTAGAGLWWIDATGKTQWQVTPNGYTYFFGPPTLGADGTIYAVPTSSGGSNLIAVNPSGTLKWSATLCGGQPGAFAADDEPVIAPDGSIYVTLDGFTEDVTCPLEKIK